MKWAYALREGGYVETAFGLRAEDRFSPLGVLYDLIDPDGWLAFNPPNYSWRGKTGGQFHQSVMDTTGLSEGQLQQFLGKNFAQALELLKKVR